MTKSLIVAVSRDLAIGRGGAIPWHLSGDLKYFKSITMGCPVIMGRKTWDSLGRPLPGRKNIVITRDSSIICEGAQKVSSLEEAFACAAGAEEVFVIGGGRVYAEAMDVVDRMYVTRVEMSVEDADVFFPEIDGAQWELSSCSEDQIDERTGVVYRFEVYSRIK